MPDSFVARLGRFLVSPGLGRRWRDLRAAERAPFAALRPLRRLARRAPVTTLYFYPAIPCQFDFAIRRVCDLLGLRMAPWAPGCSPTVVWFDETQLPSPPPAGLNARCIDIRKSTVERLFRGAFGYGYAVDPLVHAGPLLRKSEANATHDGTVLAGPLAAAEPGFVYQRLLDNLKRGMFEDLRVPIVLGEVPVVFTRRLAPEDRFGSVATEAGVHEPASVLSPAELERLAAFADAIGLDFGEMDVLRDRADGRIYVVDANKTPVAPPRRLTMTERVASMQKIADALARRWPALQ